MAEETLNLGAAAPSAIPGTAGLSSQIPGQPATISGLADATGGIKPGGMVETDIDKELFQFKSDDTPLTQLALRCKKVPVQSPVVQHFQVDEPRAKVTTSAQVTATGALQAVLPLESNDQKMVNTYHTLLVKGVDGYSADGQTKTPGRELMLYVVGRDTTSGNPVVVAVNGPKTNATDEVCKMVDIPAGSVCVLCGPACYETQKEIAPDLITPQSHTVYCQKRVMNRVVSDYFDAQKKRIPFTKAIIAETALTNFKVTCNRSYWAGRPGIVMVDTALGRQTVYLGEGIRWQFKKEFHQTGKWTVEKIIAMAKMVFTGEDVPKEVMLLAGKNLVESIQNIDYSNHPEIQIQATTNKVGWSVTSFHTVFGDIQIKHEPTLDRCGWQNSGALIAPDRLVRYVYSAEHSSSDRVEGQEATRETLILWDALCLKGSCHIWIDGEGDAANAGATVFIYWDSAEAPSTSAVVDGAVYYLLSDCPAINADARTGSLWKASKSGGNVTWKEYTGEVIF